MATFPELEPNTRSYDFGLFPLTEEPSLSAGIVRFRHSTSPQNYQLTLGYNAITDAQATLIRNHYQGQAGGYRSFSLPAIIWKGHTSNDNIVPTETLWRYSETPEEEHLAVGRINVTIALVSDNVIQPIEVPGFTGQITTSITAGTAVGTAPGFTGQITVSIAAGAASGGSGFDADAAAYIAAVEATDGQALETGVKNAINDFVVGCKADGIWTAIKASCILAGARTRLGALTPLVGPAPTSFTYVDADYDRKTGLLGASSRYLDTNRSNSADPQDSNHNAAYVAITGNSMVIAAQGSVTGTNSITALAGSNYQFRNRSTASDVVQAPVAGLMGTARASSTQYIFRGNQANTTFTISSQAPESSNVLINRRGNTSFPNYGTHRIAFYSIGEYLDLALLEARVATLINAYAAAIP